MFANIGPHPTERSSVEDVSYAVTELVEVRRFGPSSNPTELGFVRSRCIGDGLVGSEMNVGRASRNRGIPLVGVK